MTNVEEFGIAAVEAQAAGRPVVAAAAGGALETVIPGETGVLVPEDDVDAFAEAFRYTDFDRFSPREAAPQRRAVLGASASKISCGRRWRRVLGASQPATTIARWRPPDMAAPPMLVEDALVGAYVTGAGELRRGPTLRARAERLGRARTARPAPRCGGHHAPAPVDQERAPRRRRRGGGSTRSGSCARLRVGLACAAFCLLASGIYAINDVRDAHEDRLHPRKRHRPVAAGSLSPGRLSPWARDCWSPALVCARAVRPLLASDRRRIRRY